MRFINWIILIMVLLPSVVNAQQLSDENTRKIVLSPQSLKTAVSPRLNVSDIVIAIATTDTTKLGYEVATTLNDIVTLAPDTTMTLWLNQYVKSVYSNYYSPTAMRSLWVIHSLRLQQSADRCLVKLKANVYQAEVKSAQYETAGEMDTVIIMERHGKDSLVATCIAEALNCLLTVRKGNNETEQQKISMTNAIQSTNNFVPAPALRTDNLNDGIYSSFNEFRANQPGIRQTIILPDDKHPGKVKLYEQQTDSSRHEINNCWAVVVQQEIYIYQNGRLLPIEHKGQSIMLSAYLHPSERRNQAIYWRKVLGEQYAEGMPAFIEQVYSLDVSCDNGLGLAAATGIDVNTGQFIF
ncbi:MULTISPECIES: hypothetical protein [unclassified Chitinophaga]|uniref:hypothetical protein n=1 Tax=unclassified Chitinophaga TaxID=2619133 RepID=UPI00300FB53E